MGRSSSCMGAVPKPVIPFIPYVASVVMCIYIYTYIPQRNLSLGRGKPKLGSRVKDLGSPGSEP